jgi:hypothetical protein
MRMRSREPLRKNQVEQLMGHEVIVYGIIVGPAPVPPRSRIGSGGSSLW